MRFSLVIPTFNERACIVACLQSIHDQEYPRDEFEIILSDARSTDGTMQAASPLADVLVQSDRKGIAHGRNMGAAQARGDVVVFVDADVVLRKHILSLIDEAMQDPAVGGVVVKARPAGGGLFARSVYHATYALVLVFKAMGMALFPGMCVAYRREVFERVGGFREDFGVSEDLDLSRRVARIARCKALWKVGADVSTRRLQRFGLSTVVFHIYHDLKYLASGTTAMNYPKSEEVRGPFDLWRLNAKSRK